MCPCWSCAWVENAAFCLSISLLFVDDRKCSSGKVFLQTKRNVKDTLCNSGQCLACITSSSAVFSLTSWEICWPEGFSSQQRATCLDDERGKEFLSPTTEGLPFGLASLSCNLSWQHFEGVELGKPSELCFDCCLLLMSPPLPPQLGSTPCLLPLPPCCSCSLSLRLGQGGEAGEASSSLILKWHFHTQLYFVYSLYVSHVCHPELRKATLFFLCPLWRSCPLPILPGSSPSDHCRQTVPSDQCLHADKILSLVVYLHLHVPTLALSFTECNVRWQPGAWECRRGSAHQFWDAN